MKALITVVLTSVAAAQAGVPKTAVEINNEGVRLFAQGHYQEAQRMFTESLREMEAGAATRLDLGRTLDNLAAVYRVEGDPAQAEVYALKADELFANSPDIPVSERTAQRMILAAVYIDQRRFADADSVLRSASATAQGSLAALALANMAALAIPLGDFDQAEGLALQAVDRAKATVPQDHSATAVAYNNLAQACRFQKKYLEAERYYRLAIEEWETGKVRPIPDVAKGLMNLAAFFHERERENGAEDLYRRAIALLEKAFGPNGVPVLVARNELAEVLRAERRFSESDRVGGASLAALEQIFPSTDPRIERALTNRARLSTEMRRDGEAAAIKSRLTQMQRTFR